MSTTVVQMRLNDKILFFDLYPHMLPFIVMIHIIYSLVILAKGPAYLIKEKFLPKT